MSGTSVSDLLANPSDITILDGAMGTFLRTGISVAMAHRAYIEAGADIIRTNTFDLSPDSPHLPENAAIAVNVAENYMAEVPERRIFVAGSIGPTSILAENRSDRNKLFAIFREKAFILADLGVDLLIAETFFDYDVTAIALDGISSALSGSKDLPLIMSFYPKIDSRPDGDSATDSLINLTVAAGVSVIGYNCFSEDPSMTIQRVKHMKQYSGLPVLLCPSAGIPDHAGHYPVSPKDFAAIFSAIKSSAPISGFGGCCGTTPEYIKAIKNIA